MRVSWEIRRHERRPVYDPDNGKLLDPGCPRYYECLEEAAHKNWPCVPCAECKENGHDGRKENE